ncbi:hypothetical protein PHLCEN_2v937 [Hermanssonia centrifuga]|uniref:Aminoglycoside phosphotransferase domain-containing protein n=1 Tax=Hermanssonia centrifuga TaxID=98765 RepID=A0A2R6S4L9_9APHY|nr:hypothetical protein PHLCEN_2v937 [Hermanssonia centrifuga]
MNTQTIPRNPFKEIPIVIAYKLLICVADFLEDVFWARNKRELEPESKEASEVDLWDDATILDKFYGAVRAGQGLPESVDGFSELKIYKISESIVVKQAMGRTFDSPVQVPHEALALEFVRKHTSIPVPRIHRILHTETEPGTHLYVMDFIEGDQLGQVWPTLLPQWGKLRIAWTLRSYIRQLRRAKSTLSSVPGPLGDEPQTCIGFIFQGKRRVSFPDLPSLSSWFHAGVRATRERFGLPPSRRDPFRKCQKMVLTHMDLNMRNILVGKDGRIWAIDWDWAGFYPEWFEYMNLSFVSMMSTPISSQRCIPFITDPYVECIRWMQATD